MKRIVRGIWVLDDVVSGDAVSHASLMLPPGQRFAEVHVQIACAATTTDSIESICGGHDGPIPALHIDLTDPQSPLGARLTKSEDDFENTGAYVIAAARELEKMDVRAEIERQIDLFRQSFGSPAAVTVHHYIDVVSPHIRTSLQGAIAALPNMVRLRGRVEPVSALLHPQPRDGATVALHASGYPGGGAWADAEGLEPLVGEAQFVEVVTHPEDTADSLAAIACDLGAMGVLFP